MRYGQSMVVPHHRTLSTLLDPKNLNIKKKHTYIKKNNSKNITLSSNPNNIDLETHDKIFCYA